MKNNIVYILFFLNLIPSLAFSPLSPERPTLVVNIVLDNVSLHEIDRHASILSSKGLLKLKNEGSSFYNFSYPYITSDKACDYASLMTGTTPDKHGIIGTQWYDRLKEKAIECTYSKNSILIGSNNKDNSGDASQLLASTITDELKLYSKSAAKCYSISANKNAAILLAGHAANGAYWIEDKTGQWVSSDYYMAWLPEWVKTFNNKSLPDFYLNQEWTLSYKASKYDANQLTFNNKTFPLSPLTYQNTSAPYAVLKSLPMGNMLITDFATQLIKEEKLGKNNYPDFISINYNSIEHSKISKATLSIEKADFLIKLDKEIERIINLLNEEVGIENYLITLSSTKTNSYTDDYLEQHHINHGKFDPNKALALLNSYLMALYGQGEWVMNYSNSQIYLNKSLIQKSGINIRDIQELIADFMEEFSGVERAIPAYHLKYSSSDAKTLQAMKSSYYANKSGDIMISLAPGWHENSKAPTNTHFSSPLFFYGWKIKRNAITSPIRNIDIASNWAYFLGIPRPNSSSNKLIIDKLVDNK